VAKAGPSWVSYSSYLFELKRNLHYYITQQQADFNTKDGQAQLKHLKEVAMNQVISDAYVKQLASKYHVSVSGQQIANEVSLLRVQNRIGNSQQVFDNVLKEYWGWNESDFSHELSEQLLQQAVVAKLDTQTDALAESVETQLQNGGNFSNLAADYSADSSTKLSGGQYAGSITVNDSSIPPQITAELFKLKTGQISPVINTGFTLEVLKVISISGNSVQAAHIQFNFQPIANYTNSLQKTNPPSKFISV
jgi:foldase protein PrsA